MTDIYHEHSPENLLCMKTFSYHLSHKERGVQCRIAKVQKMTLSFGFFGCFGFLVLEISERY
jgi:hypothetical protein